MVDCSSHMILSAVPGRGPATDLVQFGRAWSQAARRVRIETLLADADFDAEWLHVSVRSHGVRTIIPPTRGRPSDKPPAGRWRRVMRQRFDRLKSKYGQRWQVETVNSMIKRRLGSALPARVEANQFREIMLRAITHNVMIVRCRVFYRAGHDGFSYLEAEPPRHLTWGDRSALQLDVPRRESRGSQKVASILPNDRMIESSLLFVLEATRRMELSLKGIRLDSAENGPGFTILAYLKGQSYGHFVVVRTVEHSEKLIQILDGMGALGVVDAQSFARETGWAVVGLDRVPGDWRQAALPGVGFCFSTAIVVVQRMRRRRPQEFETSPKEQARCRRDL